MNLLIVKSIAQKFILCLMISYIQSHRLSTLQKSDQVNAIKVDDEDDVLNWSGRKGNGFSSCVFNIVANQLSQLTSLTERRDSETTESKVLESQNEKNTSGLTNGRSYEKTLIEWSSKEKTRITRVGTRTTRVTRSSRRRKYVSRITQSGWRRCLCRTCSTQHSRALFI